MPTIEMHLTHVRFPAKDNQHHWHGKIADSVWGNESAPRKGEGTHSPSDSGSIGSTDIGTDAMKL
jgi:hypothetical protein